MTTITVKDAAIGIPETRGVRHETSDTREKKTTADKDEAEAKGQLRHESQLEPVK